MLYVIFWKTNDYQRIKAIKQYFNISGMTINKEAVANVSPDKEEKFFQGEQLGYYDIARGRPIPQHYYDAQNIAKKRNH